MGVAERLRILYVCNRGDTIQSLPEGLRQSADVETIHHPLRALAKIARQHYDGVYVAADHLQDILRLERLLENDRILEGMPDAVALLTQAQKQTTAIAIVFIQVLYCLSLGEAQMLAGRLGEAHALAERALALARTHQARGQQAYALRLLGDIAVRREPPERALAEAYDRQALALTDDLGMRPLQAHCHLGLGNLYGKVGR